jgi:hypothetical protein
MRFLLYLPVLLFAIVATLYKIFGESPYEA